MRFRLSLLLFVGFGCIGNCIARTTPETLIPFELKEGRPILSANVNGISLGLLFDLGGYETVALSPSDAKKVAAQRIESEQTYISSDGTRHSAFGLELDDLRIGTIDFGTVYGSEMADGGTSYVGAGLLADNLLVLDYKKQQMRIYRSGDKDAFRRECGESIFPIDIVRGVFQTYILTQGKILTAAWDTGANFSVIRPSALNLKIPDYIPGSQPEIHVFQSLQLNGAKFGSLNAALIEFRGPPADMVLGANFFQGKVVCLDGLAHSGGVR